MEKKTIYHQGASVVVEIFAFIGPIYDEQYADGKPVWGTVITYIFLN